MKNMIATLVIVLPSLHIGGDLSIWQGDKENVFSSETVEPLAAPCVAFYSSCVHSVAKVKQGYRIVLTYNLVLENVEFCLDENVYKPLQNAVENYFTCDSGGKLPILVYSLSHEYSEHGLRWDLLKGTDRSNAAKLCTIASKLKLVSYLALADVHEVWNSESDIESEEEAGSEDLRESVMTLSYWIDSNNRKMEFKDYHITDYEIFCIKFHDLSKLTVKTHRGYTGNEGNTVEHWYRHAAIVLWPESNEKTMHFIVCYDNALKYLSDLTEDPGNETEIRHIIDSSKKYIIPHLYNGTPNHFHNIMKVALYLDDKKLASTLLSEFSWKIISSDITECLVNLHGHFGINWLKNIMSKWQKYGMLKFYVLVNFDSLIKKLLLDGGDLKIVNYVLNSQFIAIHDSDKEEKEFRTSEHNFIRCVIVRNTLPQRIERIYEFIHACFVLGNISSLEKVLKYVESNQELYPSVNLAKLILQLHSEVSPDLFNHFVSLKSHVSQCLEMSLSSGEGTGSDWSLPVKLTCGCEYCVMASDFLHNKTEVKKEWTAVPRVYHHIKANLEELKIPFDLSCVKESYPCKLVLVKNEEFHEYTQKKRIVTHFYNQLLQNI